MKSIKIGIYGIISVSIGMNGNNYRVYGRIHSIRGNGRKRYCVYNNSRPSYLLASTVEVLHNMDPKGWESRGLLRFRMESALDSLVCNRYVLSNIVCYSMNNVPRGVEGLLSGEHRRGYSHQYYDEDTKTTNVWRPGCAEDLLVLMALSKRLLTLIGHPNNVYELEDLEDSHYDYISRMSTNVRRLYKIDFSLWNIKKYSLQKVVLTNVRGLSAMEEALIVMLLNNPFYYHSKDWDASWEYIPQIGEITRVLFHIFLMEQFDYKIIQAYLGITYSRLGSEMILPINYNDEMDIDIESFLTEVNLTGEIEYLDGENITPCLVCTEHQRKVILLVDGSIEVWNAEDYL